MITVRVCEEGDVRLVPVGNVNGSGRVEMCLDREWRIVGDETWGVEEATVVCRQLGLPTDGQEYSIHNTSHFANDRYLLFKMHTIPQNQWYLLYNRLSNMAFVCTLYILLILTQCL